MEIKINKDVLEYTEAIFFGLNLRQLVCSGLAIASAVRVYFNMKDMVSQDIVTYLCVAAAAPFAAIGFARYNGMPLEKVIWAIFMDCILIPRKFTFQAINLYREATRDYLERKEKEEMKEDVEDLECDTEAG